MLLLAACSEPDAPAVHTLDGSIAALDLEPLVIGDGTVTLRREGSSLVPEVAGDVERYALHGTWSVAGVAEPRLWRQGWQSWSWSGVTELDGFTMDGDLPAIGGDLDGFATLDELEGTSWEAVAVGDGSAAMVLGARSATHGKVWFAVDTTDLWIVWDGPLSEGELDPVTLYDGAEVNELWASYAEDVPGRVTGPPPTGWLDWYTFYGVATEADITENLALAADAGLEVLQVDDGWEEAWGDWEANAEFPSGTAGLAGQIAAAGMRPGLWLAPLLVARDSATYAAHDDWWVRDASGAEVDDRACDCATLDVTHPDAAAWIAGVIADRVADGYTWLKLDFLYAGAREGVRYEDVNGAEAYVRATTLLREAAGDDTWIVACGAPMLPSVGFADSFRSGADIAFAALPDPEPAFLRWQARSTAARGWANGRWWWNDADALLVRAPFDPVSGAVAAQAASGGPWFLGDDLRTLETDRLATALVPVALRGQTFTPDDPFAFPSGLDASPVVELGDPDDTVPTRWVGADGTVLLLNLGEDPITEEGPGGTEMLTGEEAAAGPRTLAAGEGEIWR